MVFPFSRLAQAKLVAANKSFGSLARSLCVHVSPSPSLSLSQTPPGRLEAAPNPSCARLASARPPSLICERYSHGKRPLLLTCFWALNWLRRWEISSICAPSHNLSIPHVGQTGAPLVCPALASSFFRSLARSPARLWLQTDARPISFGRLSRPFLRLLNARNSRAALAPQARTPIRLNLAKQWARAHLLLAAGLVSTLGLAQIESGWKIFEEPEC